MNQEFEAIVMNTYAELCIMWRVAHVTDQKQAHDFDAKLKSLEAVVAAFDLTTPSELEDAASNPPAQSEPVEPEQSPRNTVPPLGSNTIPAGPPPAAAGMVLED